MTEQRGIEQFRVFDLVSPEPVVAGLEEVVARLRRRDANGDNYVEVFAADDPGPMLGFSLHDDMAAVNLIDGETGYLLAGDGSVPDTEVVAFRDPYEPTTDRFTGNFLVTTETAVSCFRAFARGGNWPRTVAWIEL